MYILKCIALIIVLSFTTEAHAQYKEDETLETPRFIFGVGIGLHQTSIDNFDESYDTDSWIMYNFDFGLKVYQVTNALSLWGQLSLTGGETSVTETIGGSSATFTFQQHFINYGGRVALTYSDNSMSWLGLGLGSGGITTKSEFTGNTDESTDYSDEGSDVYFELGNIQSLYDNSYIYIIWRGVSQEINFTDDIATDVSGQHFILGLGWNF